MDFLGELSSYQVIDPKILARAEKSNITERNHKGFKALINAWVSGVYDNDVPQLINELDTLMQQRL